MDIVKCGHKFCSSCFDKAQIIKAGGRKQDNKVYQACPSIGCKSIFSKLSAQRFMEKIEEMFIMVSSSFKLIYRNICAIHHITEKRILLDKNDIHLCPCNRTFKGMQSDNTARNNDIVALWRLVNNRFSRMLMFENDLPSLQLPCAGIFISFKKNLGK